MAIATLRVRDAMAHTISTATPADTIRRVAELMKLEDAGCIPIVEGDLLVGVVTDRDIVLRCLAVGKLDPNEPVGEIMTSQVATIGPDDDLGTAGHRMAEAGVRRLPVVENGTVIGMLTFGNLVQATHMTGGAIDAALGVTRGA
jgi:CBS domain-containing protein